MKAELADTNLRTNIAHYVRDNYCFCNKKDCASCLLSKCLGRIEVEEIK